MHSVALYQSRCDFCVSSKSSIFRGLSFIVQFEAKVLSLQDSLKERSSVNSDLEQRCHSLSRQLEVAQLAVQELQGDREQVTSLEGQVEILTRESSEQQTLIHTLEEVRSTVLYCTV